MRRKLGKYELVAPLSTGGMAQLYLALVPGPGGFRKAVALKHVLPDLRDDQRFIERFLDEARLTAGLSHPNVGQVFDLGQEGDDYYLAMEFIPGVALHQVLARARLLKERLPLGFACRVVRDAALGLHHAHTYRDPTGRHLGLIHRDVKPNNIMVTFEGMVKVIDFGIAKASGRLAKTQTGVVMGTLQYMPLEQLNEGPVDARSDLFSLGVVLWELLAGEYLYTALDPVQRLAEETPDIAGIADVPPAVAAVVRKALQARPEARHATARDMARALELASPELFDEERVGALVTRLFPDTQAAVRQLLALAQGGQLDDAAIQEQAQVLRRADRGLTALSNAPPRAARSAPAAPPAAPLTSTLLHATKGRSRTALIALLGAGLAAASFAIGVAAWHSAPAPVPQVADLSSPAARAARLARASLLSRGPLEARRIVDECRDGERPCAGLESLEADINSELRAQAKARAARQPRADLRREVGERLGRAALEVCAALGRLGLAPRLERLEELDRRRAPSSELAERYALDEAIATASADVLAAAVVRLDACLAHDVDADRCHETALVTFAAVSFPDAHTTGFGEAKRTLAAFRQRLQQRPPSHGPSDVVDRVRLVLDEPEEGVPSPLDDGRALLDRDHLASAILALREPAERGLVGPEAHGLLGLAYLSRHVKGRSSADLDEARRSCAALHVARAVGANSPRAPGVGMRRP